MALRPDFKTSLFSCLVLLAACSGGDDDSGGDAYEKVLEAQPSALLAIWGSSASDVWVVGGRPSDDASGGPTVLHYNGTAWETMDTGETSLDLWWIFGFSGGPVFMGGSGGAILKYEGGSFERMTTPGTGVVFGIWGASADDVWAVGGQFGGGGGGFAWHYDGSTWTADETAPNDITLFKNNGRNASDMWIVGEAGTTVHWDGGALTREDVPTDASFFSIGCSSARCLAVGGEVGRGVVYENEGSGWNSARKDDSQELRGACVASDTSASAVGNSGVLMDRSDADGWLMQDAVTNLGLHACWIDPGGGAWAVGGKFDDLPLRDGILVHRGDAVSSDIQ
jgi:hypothetical protein